MIFFLKQHQLAYLIHIFKLVLRDNKYSLPQNSQLQTISAFVKFLQMLTSEVCYVFYSKGCSENPVRSYRKFLESTYLLETASKNGKCNTKSHTYTFFLKWRSSQPINQWAKGNRIFLAHQKRTLLRHAVWEKCLTNAFPAPDFKSNYDLFQTGKMGHKSVEREEISGESTKVCKL